MVTTNTSASAGLCNQENTHDQCWLDQLAETVNQQPEGQKDVAALGRALSLARQQGLDESAVNHARAVVDILAALQMDIDTLVAGFIGALGEHGLSLADVRSAFNVAIADLVEGVQKMRIVDDFHQHAQDGDTQHLEGLRKLLLGMADDVRVVFVKLAERVQIMRELKLRPVDVQRRVAQETMDIFAPLANRLGIWQLKWELEDLSFRFLQPETYMRVASLLDERRVDRERYIAQVLDNIRDELQRAGLHGEVAGRPKHIYSIWRKMSGKSVDFKELFDVRAARVLVDTVADCYAVLGLLHSRWQPIRSEFDDYIASPKGNMYQSLHTAVIGPEGKTLEIQIRTHEMHQHSEYGVAAHWGYKEGGQHDVRYGEKIAWLRQILEWKDEERDARDFIDRFKSEVFQDRVYVLTPDGKVVDLPSGGTPLDFAYHIHTDVGHRYRGAKVNGRIVPIAYELQNGEQVEVLTSREASPSRDWLNPHLGYLKSSRARAKVRSWFRLQDFERNVSDGRVMLDRELHRLSVTDVNLEQLAKRFNYEKLDGFLAALGCGDLSSAQIAGAVNEQVLPPATEILPPVARRQEMDGGGDVFVMGVGDLMTHIARCCKPVPFDAIVGYVTRGRGVTIHRRDCPNLLRLQQMEQERLMEVNWAQDIQNTYSVEILVHAYDRQGLLRDITEILSDDRLNVMGVNTLTDRRTHIADMTLSVDVNDATQLSVALSKIEQLPNVIEVRRRSS